MPIVTQAEVPGYITYQPVEKTGVHVIGGSNWDISRSALETPITPVPIYSQDGNNSSLDKNTVSTAPEVKKSIKKRRTVKKIHKKILVRQDCPCKLDK